MKIREGVERSYIARIKQLVNILFYIQLSYFRLFSVRTLNLKHILKRYKKKT